MCNSTFLSNNPNYYILKHKTTCNIKLVLEQYIEKDLCLPYWILSTLVDCAGIVF